ncbi:MAG: universal stress protein [Chloroflexi bacterium]|nr:universal stress protein [Chloroflexota bacterium]
MVHVDPLGALLGVVFVTAIGALLVWMFRVPPVSTLSAAKAYSSLSAVRKVLVPITDAFPSERAIGLACRLGREQKAEMVLLNVIIVPFSMALDMPAPAAEIKASQILELGAVIAQKYGYTVRKRIIHHRSIPDGILQVAQEEEVDAIVLGVGLKTRASSQWGKTSLEIMRRATCEVIVDKVPMEEEPLAPAV